VGLRTVTFGLAWFSVVPLGLKIKTDQVVKRWRAGLLHPSMSWEDNGLVPHKPLSYSIGVFLGVVKPFIKHYKKDKGEYFH